MRRLPGLILFLTALFAAGSVAAEDIYGPEAVWEPSESPWNAFWDCGPDIGCLSRMMSADGASPQAIAFMEDLEGMGYLSELTETGAVDLGQVILPMRANENVQYVMANGNPPLIMADDFDYLKQLDISTEPLYPSLKSQFPQLTMWPGHGPLEGVVNQADGGQRFIFDKLLLDGCHACAHAGYARVAYDFDSRGEFLGTQLLGLVIDLPEALPVAAPTPTSNVPDTPRKGTGPQIAYEDRDNNIWLYSLETGSRELLTQGEGYGLLRWSPDGEYLLFHGPSSITANASAAWVVNANGSERKLVAPSAFHNGAYWSPDGRSIAFVGPGDPPMDSSGGFTAEIFIYDAESGQTRQLTSSLQLKKSMAWSPDGSQIAFGSYSPDSGRPALFLVDVATGDERGLGPIQDAATVIWASDPQTIIFSSPGFGLSFVNALTGATRTVNNEAVVLSDHAVSPDGRQIASSCFVNMIDQAVCIVDVRSGERWELSKEVSGSPSWSADGSQLVAAGVDGIYLVDAVNGITEYLVGGSSPAWRPDGRATVDPGPWIEEKRALISQLESVNIPTSFLWVPSLLPPYDETEARALLSQIEQAATDGALTPEQLEAFSRLTIQERALAQMLPVYTDVAFTISASATDMMASSLALVFSLRPLWRQCEIVVALCGPVGEATEGLSLRLTRHASRLIVHSFPADPEHGDGGAQVADLTLRLVEDSFAQGHSLKEILVENAVEAAVTEQILLRMLYLPEMQELLDAGVASASTGGNESFPITGESERATMLVEDYVKQAAIRQDAALDRYRDFEDAADILDIADELADVGSLASVVWRVVAIGARIERAILVSGPLIWANSRDLDCIEYLSEQAAVSAFQADQPFSGCADPETHNLDLQPRLSLAPRRQENQNIRYTTLPTLDSYELALDKLIAALNAGDDTVIEEAFEVLSNAEQEVEVELNRRIALTQTASANGENVDALTEATTAFMTDNLLFYLAFAETMMAHAEGRSPEVDLLQAETEVRNSLAILHEVLAAPVPSSPEPVLLIEGVQAALTSEDQLQVTVAVSNVGLANADDVEIRLVDGTGEVLAGTTMAVAPGAVVDLHLVGDIPSNRLPGVQLWHQNALLDAQLVSVAESAHPPSSRGSDSGAVDSVAFPDPATLSVEEPAEAAVTTNDGALFIAAAIVIIAVVLLVVVLRRQRGRSRG